ncbi:MAG: hypothetical protein OEY07_20415, partial [Gammaproteobacteria bacterium]|nr:hypothetical protein [Gammaproteobacteria bacterium]
MVILDCVLNEHFDMFRMITGHQFIEKYNAMIPNRLAFFHYGRLVCACVNPGQQKGEIYFCQ